MMQAVNDVMLRCCRDLTTCDYSNSYLIKDVYNPEIYKGPAVGASIVSVLFFLITGASLFNLLKIFPSRHRPEARIPLIMNLLVFASTLFWILYSLDGPIQLISYRDGFFPSTIATFEISAICFLQLSLAFSAYQWTFLILTYKDSSYRVLRALRLFFISNVALTGFILIYTLIAQLLNKDYNYNTSEILIAVVSLVNGLFFSVGCFLLGKNLDEIYFFVEEQKSKVYMLKFFAIGVAFISAIRSLHDASNFFNNWQTVFKVESYCGKDPRWTIYLVLFMIFADMLPIVLFIIMFSPTIRQKAQESFMRSYSEYMQENNADQGNGSDSD